MSRWNGVLLMSVALCFGCVPASGGSGGGGGAGGGGSMDAGDGMDGFLQVVVGRRAGAGLEDGGLRAGQETDEKVDDIQVIDRTDEVLRVEPSGKLQAQEVGNVVFQAQPGLDRHF